jgi:hypothetical protein
MAASAKKHLLNAGGEANLSLADTYTKIENKQKLQLDQVPIENWTTSRPLSMELPLPDRQ